MKRALLLFLVACGGPPAPQVPDRPPIVEYVHVPVRWIEPYVRTDTEDFRAWSSDAKNQTAIAMIRHVLIRSKTDADGARKRAEAILARAKSGESFEKLALESEDGSKMNGGAVGTDPSKFVEPFRKAAEALAPGQISNVVETQFGFHVIAKDPITPETTAAAYRREHAMESAKKLADAISKARSPNPIAMLGDVALSDPKKPAVVTFESGDLEACNDKKEQMRRVMLRTRTSEETLLCWELSEITKFAAKAHVGDTLTLPIPPHETDPIVVWAR